MQNDGAWIVKNSYDTDWGKDGYFYVSYEDQSLSNLVCNTATTSPEYPNNYFYDGATTSTVTFPFKTGYSIANIFTANAGNGHYEATRRDRNCIQGRCLFLPDPGLY